MKLYDALNPHPPLLGWSLGPGQVGKLCDADPPGILIKH